MVWLSARMECHRTSAKLPEASGTHQPKSALVLRHLRPTPVVQMRAYQLPKIEAGEVELTVEKVDVQSTVNDVVAAAKPLANKNRNQLLVDFRDAPNAIETEPLRFRQVLFNLLSNACKFTHDGTVSLEASSDRRDGKEWLVVRLSDTGIGMTDERMAKVLEPFAQADASTTRKYGGTGLGLVLSQRLWRVMGGVVSLTSEAGKEATFTVELPVRR